MGSIDGFINGLTKFTQTVGAVQGAADALMPAMYAIDHTVNQVANVFTGDSYYPYNPYPAYPAYPVYPPMPIGSNDPGMVGVIGKILAGGTAGYMTHGEIGEGFKQLKAGTPGGFKTLGLGALKAGGIGAAVSGVVSGIQNMVRVSQGIETKAGAAGNVAADTVGGLLAGSTAGLMAGGAGLLLSRMGAQVGGIPFAIGVAAAGALGAVGADMLFQGTGAREGIARSIRRSMGGY